MWKTRNSSGFTLIELLIVVSILAIISTAIFAALSSGINVYRRVQACVTKQINILLTLEKMEKDLRNALNLSSIAFYGDAREVNFPGLITEYDGDGNPVASVGEISYRFDDETGSLIRKERNYALEGGPAAPLAPVENAAFSYYYFDKTRKKHAWKDSWTAEDGIPKAVRIELKFNDGSKDVELGRTIFIPTAE